MEMSYISINDNEHFLVSLKKLLSILVSISFCIFEPLKMRLHEPDIQ